MRKAMSILAGLAAFLAAAPALAQIDAAPKVHARLIAEQDAVAPGASVTVALEQDIRTGWHTYWSNPGDAGAPTEIHWTLPQGWHADAIQWPYPKREAVGQLMDYGYEGKPWLLNDLTAPPDAKPGDEVTIKAAVSWLVCQEVCIPEEAALSLPLKIAAQSSLSDPVLAIRFAAAREKLPKPSPWAMRYRLSRSLDLFVATLAPPHDAAFFPLAPDMVKGIAPQSLGSARDGMVLRLEPGRKLKAKGGALDGVLVLTSSDGSVDALKVHAEPGPVPEAAFGGGNELGLAFALLFAFIGGLILNLMPCVLPVLAMKALALAGGRAAREGLAYGAGAILSFLALGAVIVVLRSGGMALGWGFQLQEPLAVAGFALLIFAVGLNLSGVFELPGLGAGQTLARKGGAAGAFFTGVLAVAVAAPCTAPFMAAALGYALTQSAGIALVVFLILGIGFAAPFTAIALSPRLLRLLPRPGAWMLRFKQALAFPMYGAAAWLVWVLAHEAGADGVAAILGAMLAFAAAAWIWTASRTATARGRGFGAFATLLALIAALSFLAMLRASPPERAHAPGDAGLTAERYTPARLEQLRAQNRPVLVNATAAWCITCLVNEQVALSGARVRAAFAHKHVAYLVADWTNRDPDVSALLQAHRALGVPLYLYYAPGAADAVMLPQILTEGEVLQTIGAN